MDEKRLKGELQAIRKEIEGIRNDLVHLNAKTKGDWILSYYDSVGKIPNSFSKEEWLETEKIIGDSILEAIKGDFVYRGMFQSGMRKEMVKVFSAEREKFLGTKRSGFME